MLIAAKSQRKIVYLEKFAQNHPYITYFARIFGEMTGMYFQFRIPYGTLDLIKNLFLTLKHKDHLDDFHFLQFDMISKITSFDLTKWNFENYTWNFDWNQWFQIENIGDSSQSPSNPSKESITWLQKKDIALLNKLIVNARRPNTQIKEELSKIKYTMSDSTLTRRKKRLEDECILGYHVQINPHIFDVANTVLIWGYGPVEEITKIYLRMNSHPIPFYSTLKCEKSTFLWYIHLPTQQLSDLLHILQKVLYEINLSFVDYPQSVVYSLDAEMFNEKIHEWDKNPDTLTDQVIENTDRAFLQVQS